MDQESFYKDQYDKSLSGRTDINSSIATPIGILTALLAGLYFCATNFDYNDAASLTWFFIAAATLSAVFLLVAIIYLILAIADFLPGRSYFYLNDADIPINIMKALSNPIKPIRQPHRRPRKARLMRTLKNIYGKSTSGMRQLINGSTGSKLRCFFKAINL